MGRRGMPGRRRQVVQLDENLKTSYLTQTGCYRPDDMFVESKIKSGLALVGEYSDSESDSEEEAEQTETDVEYKLNGDIQMGGEESQILTEKNDSLQAEMLELVGVKKETSADIFLREFQAYQKESVAPVYTREFIAFQKESKDSKDIKENVERSPTPTSSKDAPKETSTTKSSDDASPTTKTDKASSSGLKAPDIDSQVASFLAEIDALGDEEEKEKVEESNETGGSDRSSSVDPEQNAESSTTSSESKNKDPPNSNGATTGASKTAKDEVEVNAAASLPPLPPKEEKIVWPEEPVTEWQQCYDDNTQHCYYWNISSNEVTWEIPAEFTQYLLLYREYEEKVNKLMKDGKSKPRKKKSQKKSEKNKAKQSEIESESSSKDSSAEPQVEYGPHLPPSINNQKDTCGSPETAGPAPADQEPTEPMEPIYGPMMKPDSPPERNKEKGEESDASNSSSTGKNTHNTVGDNIEEEEEGNNITDNKIPAADALTTPVRDTGSPAGSTAAVTVSATSVDEGSTGESLTADLAMIELCKKKFKARMSREEDSGKASASADSGAKDNSLPTGIEGSLLDIDEVDRELELALERKKCELKSLEEEEEKQSHESVKVRGKRKHRNDRASDDSSADEVHTQKSSKRSRDQRSRDRKESSKHSKKTKHKKDDTNGISSDDSCPQTSKKSRSSDQKKSHRSHQSKKESRPKKVKERDSKSRSCDDGEENKLKESALDLSQLVMDKMDFLEIDVSKQSKLQVLCIQLKTRISDWHAGGLSTKYFYVKLQEANQQLGQYEKSGAPAGWSVNWDRTCKRYFYTNNTTGNSQWEYPEPPTKEEGNELVDNPGSIAGSLPLPLLPPPPPPPSSSPSPSALEKTPEVSEEADKEHKKAAKECERRDRSSEKEKYSSSKSEGRKEKRSRKESKSSKSSRSKDSSKSKSRSESSTCSKLKDYDCEMSVYPGEPPPPGTEPNLQPSALTVSSAPISQTNSPQLDNKDSLNLSPSAEDDLEDVMNLAASLSEPATVHPAPSASGVTDDMEIDPEDEIATPAPLVPSADFQINSTNAGSNGTIMSMPDAVGSHNANSSAVISKPPHLTRPAVSAESLPVSASASGLESSLSYSGRMEATVGDAHSMSHIAFTCLPELSNESSNSPKPTDNHEATEPIKIPKEKRKKKDKVITGTSLTLKKKNVSSLVQKWQKVKKEVEKEDELARHEFSDGD